MISLKMKTHLSLFSLFFPFILFGQQLNNSQLEKFPNFKFDMTSGIPTPVQYNSANIFSPTVNLNCQIKGYAVTNYNCAVFTSIGPGVLIPIVDTLEKQTVFYPNYWITPSNMMNGFGICAVDFNFTDFGALESYLLYGMCPENSSVFSYNENNLIESFQSTLVSGGSFQQHNFYFEWTDNNQSCEIIKNNTVISSFQSDSLGNSAFQFDSLGKLINYTNISDYSTFNTGPPLNDGYVRVDTINFQYDDNGKILNAHMKQYFNYLLGSSNPDSIIIFNSNLVEMNIDYHWVEENQVEVTFNTISNTNDNLDYFDISDYELGINGSDCLNEQLVSKIIYNVDSSEYITSAMYLDSNSTTLLSYIYHFCDEDTVVYGCTDQNACNYDTVANYSGTVLGISPSSQGPCVFAQEFVDCVGNCFNDSDQDGVCDELESSGCQDEIACNYHDLDGIEDDGSCLYPELYYDCEGNCINDLDLDEVCDEFDNDDGIGIEESDVVIPQLVKMIDIFGRVQHEHRIGLILFYIYDNGKVEKKVIF